MSLTPRLSLDYWPEGTTQPNLLYNDTVQLLDILTAGGALSKTTAAEPGSPSSGDVYILPASPTGSNWGSAPFAENDVVWYDGTAWQRWAPVGRPLIWVDDDAQLNVWDGSAWVAIAEALP